MLNRFQQLLQRLIRPAETLAAAESPAFDEFELPEPLAFKDEDTDEELPVADEVEPGDAPSSHTLSLERESHAVANGPEQSAAADLIPRLSEPRSEPLPAEVPEWERAHLAEAPARRQGVNQPMYFSETPAAPSVEAPEVSNDDADPLSAMLSDLRSLGINRPGAPDSEPSFTGALPRQTRTVSGNPLGEIPHNVPEEETHTDQGTDFSARLAALLDSFERTTQDREQDQLRTLQRLEGLLQKLLDTQPDLSHVSDRLDQLESAHVLRGRL